jgi:hypothetical protein
MQEILKNIPKVDKVLESKELESLRKKYKHEILVNLNWINYAKIF